MQKQKTFGKTDIYNAVKTKHNEPNIVHTANWSKNNKSATHDQVKIAFDRLTHTK